MHACAGQQRSILIPVFESTFSRFKVFSVFFHQVFLVLLLFNCDQSTFKVFHNLQEIFETERVSLYFHSLHKLNSFIRITTDFRQDSFDSFEVNIPRLVLVKDVENSSEIFDLLLCVDFKNVKFSVQNKQNVKALFKLTIRLLLFFILLVFFLFFRVVGQVYCCNIDVCRLINRLGDLRRLHLLVQFGFSLFFLIFLIIV